MAAAAALRADPKPLSQCRLRPRRAPPVLPRAALLTGKTVDPAGLLQAGSSRLGEGPVAWADLRAPDRARQPISGRLVPLMPLIKDRGTPHRNRSLIMEMADGGVMERMYTTKQVAEAWAVNPETVRRLAARGDLRSVRVGSERRYPESALREYLQSREDAA